MNVDTFEQGMKLAFRINDLQKDVAAFLKVNYSNTAALPVFSAEAELHKTVSKAVHTAYGEMMKANPEVRKRAEEVFPKEKIDEILSEGEASSAEEVGFKPIE